jgi:hypothetical protein
MAFKTTLLDAVRAASHILVDDQLVEETSLVLNRVIFQTGCLRVGAEADQAILVDEDTGASFFLSNPHGLAFNIEFIVGVPLTQAAIQQSQQEHAHG